MRVSLADATQPVAADTLARAAIKPANLPRLAGDALHLWLIRLPLDDAALRRRAEEVANGNDRARADRLRFATDRRRQLHSHGVLRIVLGSYLGQPPEDLCFVENGHGKPALASSDGIHFNLSHCRDRVLVALTRRAEIGVDVEEIRELRDRDVLVAHCFGSDEQSWLAGQPASTQATDFFRLWSAKEAVLKAIGSGLSIPPASVSVALGMPGSASDRVVSAPGADDKTAATNSAWTLVADSVNTRHVIAVAVRAHISPADIRCFELADKGVADAIGART